MRSGGKRPFADIRNECHSREMTAFTAPHTTIDTDTAFEAMRIFLEAYWHRGGRGSDDIANLLGSLNRAERGQIPLDPAMWSDWLQAVQGACGEAGEA